MAVGDERREIRSRECLSIRAGRNRLRVPGLMRGAQAEGKPDGRLQTDAALLQIDDGYEQPVVLGGNVSFTRVRQYGDPMTGAFGVDGGFNGASFRIDHEQFAAQIASDVDLAGGVDLDAVRRLIRRNVDGPG